MGLLGLPVPVEHLGGAQVRRRRLVVALGGVLVRLLGVEVRTVGVQAGLLRLLRRRPPPAALPAQDDEGRPGDRTRLGAALKGTGPEVDRIEQREALLPLVASLPERDRTILALRFFDGLTQTEIGQRVGISQMHVSRLLSRSQKVAAASGPSRVSTTTGNPNTTAVQHSSPA